MMRSAPLILLCTSLIASPLVARADAPLPKPASEPQAASPTTPEEAEAYYELYRTLADTIDQVERNYVREIPRRELMEAAIEGIMDRLDPYSSYINPEEVARFRSSIEAEFGGIGIQITIEKGVLRVLSPLVGTPAYRAGIRAGDAIVQIEGKPTDKLSVREAVRRLKGPAGSSVRLTIEHPHDGSRESVTLKRERIHVETVLGDRRKADDRWDYVYDREHGIGYIRLTAFSRETASELREALTALRREGMQALILDLRFNPGGLLTSAVKVSDLFVSEGLIVSTEGRNSKPREMKATAEGTFEHFPMVVLVNRYSASASEIVAACLQDHGRAVVVGERTWGKGSVQNVIELEEGRSVLKLTTAAYRRPSGRNIHRFPDAKPGDEWGVTPDAPLRLGDDELSRLMQDRRQRDVVTYHGPPPPAVGAPPEPAAEPSEPPSGMPVTHRVDRQLSRALDQLSAELARAE